MHLLERFKASDQCTMLFLQIAGLLCMRSTKLVCSPAMAIVVFPNKLLKSFHSLRKGPMLSLVGPQFLRVLVG